MQLIRAGFHRVVEITAARLANAQWSGEKPSICVLERGSEWLPGKFPDNLIDGAGALRSEELAALLSPRVRQALTDNQVTLVRFAGASPKSLCEPRRSAASPLA